jgi:GDP-L-fucose synthase
VPSTLYGPAYHSDGRQLHFIFDLIRKIASAKVQGTPVELWGDGNQKRELIHIDDFVSTALYLSDHVDNSLVNVGAGEEFSIRTFAQLICAHVGFDPDAITYDTTRYVGARSKCLLIDRLRGLMPEFNPVALSVGLPPVIDWVCEQLVQPKVGDLG